MMLARRNFVQAAAGMLVAPAILGRARAADEIKIASILDLSGGLDIYGKPMHQCMQLAVEEINQSGGLLGKQVSMVSFDTQSNMQLYAQYAQQAALEEKVSLVHGAITSASREVIRPILDRYKTLLLYSTQYEGGVCDINTFCTGATPAMQVAEPLKWAISKWGKKIYAIGADYNAPRIIADWVKYFAGRYGAEVVANDFFPLNVTEFGPLITKIQQAKPDMIFATLVGAAHVGFYRQWGAAGMLGKIPIMSFSFGAGNEEVLLPPDDCNGIVVPSAYFRDLTTPQNRSFTERYAKRFNTDSLGLNNVSIGGYEGTMVWAEAVKKAGSADRMKVIEAMETVTYVGPAGAITMDPATHHGARDISLGQVQDRKWTVLESYPHQMATDDGGRCDLKKNPRTNQQFTPQI
jgi:urea transport system substrate-binding protein